MDTVELHQAFVWTCETCGLNNFVRSETMDAQRMAAIAAEPGNEEIAEALEYLAEADAIPTALGGHWCTAPDHVTCEHCGEMFDVVEET